MTPQQRLQALQNLLQEIESVKAPSAKELQGWLEAKDGLNPSPGKHHKNRQVTRGQIKGDVESLIFLVGKMVG